MQHNAVDLFVNKVFAKWNKHGAKDRVIVSTNAFFPTDVDRLVGFFKMMFVFVLFVINLGFVHREPS